MEKRYEQVKRDVGLEEALASSSDEDKEDSYIGKYICLVKHLCLIKCFICVVEKNKEREKEKKRQREKDKQKKREALQIRTVLDQ